VKAMGRAGTVWFFLSVSSSGFAAEALGEGEDPWVAHVIVRNHAGLPREASVAATDIARSVLERAGVPSDWRDSVPGDILLEVLGPRQCTALRASSDALGLALLPKDGSRARYAAVFLEKAEALARLGDASTAQVLGHAMAHEIGHLLLETGEHSATGLMRARWSAPELRRAAWGQLLFTPEQSARLRAVIASGRPARVAPLRVEHPPSLKQGAEPLATRLRERSR